MAQHFKRLTQYHHHHHNNNNNNTSYYHLIVGHFVWNGLGHLYDLPIKQTNWSQWTYNQLQIWRDLWKLLFILEKFHKQF